MNDGGYEHVNRIYCRIGHYVGVNHMGLHLGDEQGIWSQTGYD